MPRAFTQSHLPDLLAMEQDMGLLLLLVALNSQPVHVGWTEVSETSSQYSTIEFMITERNVCICALDKK